MAISVDNTYMLNYDMDTSNSQVSKISNQIENASTDEETLEACKEFEAYMIEQMYKGMLESAKTLAGDEEDSGNDYLEMFQDTYLQSLSASMMGSGQSLGIADQLYNSIMANSGKTTEAVTEVNTDSTASDATTQG
ncbi:MAG: rod-binding protein [Eubacterium sp.]|nr:rod-binding protein [Eubacterium sp.]